jgi:hypothetical protein
MLLRHVGFRLFLFNAARFLGVKSLGVLSFSCWGRRPCVWVLDAWFFWVSRVGFDVCSCVLCVGFWACGFVVRCVVFWVLEAGGFVFVGVLGEGYLVFVGGFGFFVAR